MTKLAPEWVRTGDPVIRSPARYRWTTAPTVVTSRDIFCLGGFKTYMFYFCDMQHSFVYLPFRILIAGWFYIWIGMWLCNVNMYVEVLQLLSGLQYSCSRIQGDISVDAIASLKDYFIVQSKVIFSKVGLMSQYNSYDVWMTLFCFIADHKRY